MSSLANLQSKQTWNLHIVDIWYYYAVLHTSRVGIDKKIYKIL